MGLRQPCGVRKEGKIGKHRWSRGDQESVRFCVLRCELIVRAPTTVRLELSREPVLLGFIIVIARVLYGFPLDPLRWNDPSGSTDDRV